MTKTAFSWPAEIGSAVPGSGSVATMRSVPSAGKKAPKYSA